METYIFGGDISNLTILLPLSLAFSIVLGDYVEGDQISEDDQNMEFNYCDPDDSTGTSFSLAKHSGKVFLLEMSASWCVPCYNAIPEGEEIYQYWADDERVQIAHFLDDIGLPLSCSQWGNAGTAGIPPIIDDGILNPVRDWFPIYADTLTSIYPITIFIDHNMEVFDIKFLSLDIDDANYIIETMLDNIQDNDVYGCPDPVACNYNPNATIDDGTCIYYDCASECGGSAEYDECGVCNGSGTSCLDLGDLNDDELINLLDLILLVGLILEDDYNELGDVNEDGLINILDVLVLLNFILYGDQNNDSDGDGVADEEDSDPYNPYQCSDNDGDTCDDCTSGSYDPQNDGYDPDGDGQCEDGDCLLYIILAENELENIFFNIYNNEDFAYCLDNLDDNPTCIGDLLELENVIYLYDTALLMCPANSSANFGSAIVNLMSIATDPELNELINRWFEFFNSEDESLGRMAGFSMGLPSGQSSYNDFNSSNIYNIFSKLIVNPTNVSNVLGRNTEDAPYLQELQNIIESEFIPRINTSISKIENVINQDYNFMISGEMQGDIYQEDIEMDDTEFYLIKAYMHYYNALFHIITTYDISEIAVDISDYTVLNKDHPFLTIRESSETYMPIAFQQLNDLYASLDNSFNHLINETDWQENDYIQNDISDDNYNKIVDKINKLEDCLDGECIQSMKGCDNWECSFEYDGYWKEYKCDCAGEEIEIENTINLGNFMNNPPQNLKEYIPDYTISNDECTSGSGDEMLFTVGSGMDINSFSIVFDSDPYQGIYGLTRNFKSITINTTSGSYTIDRPENWTSLSPPPPDPSEDLPEWMSDQQTRTHLNWHIVNMYEGNEYYITASDDVQPVLYISLYGNNTWDLVSDHYFSDHYTYEYYGYSCCGGVSASSSSSNPFPCPQLTWAATTYDYWVAEWTGGNVIININSNMGIDSLSIAFDGDPFYWDEYGYYAREFNSITINSIYGNTTITRPDRWDEMTSQTYNFPQQDASIPDWVDQENLRNPMAWHLVSMGSGDLFYLFASDENSEIYSLLYSDNYWGMNSDNTFSDHWINFSSNGNVLFSYEGTASALTQEPIDKTINGLYPEITIEEILLLYKNLFNIDENNWQQTIFKIDENNGGN